MRNFNKILTVYNCGTNYDENNKQELISLLSQATSGHRGIDWAITAGPGSSLISDYYYDPFQVVPPVIPKDEGWMAWAMRKAGDAVDVAMTPVHATASAATYVPRKVNMVRGSITGYGMEYNLEALMDALDEVKSDKGNLPETINMAGWSRGAITCHLMANGLARRYPRIKVNIFAMDPVPGTGNFDNADYINIPNNVKNYTAVFMENETRAIMIPAAVNVLDKNATNVNVLFMPGQHATGVEKQSAERPEVFEICRHLAIRFLKNHGTVLNSTGLLTPQQQIDKYGKIVLDTAHYLGLGTSTTGKTFVQRRSGDSEGYYEMGRHFDKGGGELKGYFINEHHEGVFQKTFPHLYRLKTKGADAVGKSGEAMAEAEMKNLQSLCPRAYDSLVKWPGIQLIAMAMIEKDEEARDTLIKKLTGLTEKTEFLWLAAQGESLF